MKLLILFGVFLAFFYHFCEMCGKPGSICYCDNACERVGDCCPDHKLYGNLSSLRNISTCKNLRDERNSKVWIIDKCRKEQDYWKDFCLRKRTSNDRYWMSTIPVIGYNDLIYENAYCAMCNGERKFKYMNVSLKCSKEKWFNLKEANNFMQNRSMDCFIQPVINPEKERDCEELLINCPKESLIDDLELVNNCSLGPQNPVTDLKKKYRNIYCCQCWNVTCLHILFGAQHPFKFSYLLNFNEWEDITLNEGEFNTTVLGSKYNNSINIPQTSIVDSVVFYMSFLFTCLSMVSLSFLIILYIIQESFHNFGGYLTICLCSCLWLMNLLTLLVLNSVIVQSPLCIYISIFQHFIALATFAWMAVYALDLLQTFGIKSANMNKRKSLKKFCVYCFICFTFSAGLVSVSSIIEFSAPSNSTIRPRYGGDHCWFTNKLGGIIWYFIPVCLILIWNLGTCIIVFYKIISTSRDCRVVKQKESNSTLWLCIRLTAVFGIGYIFQILIIFTQTKFLIICGSILNCLQGLFLTICFAMTKRVHSAITKTLTSMTTKESTNTNMTTSTRLQPN